MGPSTPDGRPQRKVVGSANFLVFGLISIGALVGLAAIGVLLMGRSTPSPKPETADVSTPSTKATAKFVSTSVAHNHAKGVGTLIGGKDCEWGPSEMPTEEHSRLVPGKIALTKGVAEIRLDQGAVLILEGPAVFEIRTKNSAMLHRGKLVAHVPQRAKGFQLQTTTATIIDLGLDAGSENEAVQVVPNFTPLVEDDLFGPDAAETPKDAPAGTQLKEGESLQIPATPPEAEGTIRLGPGQSQRFGPAPAPPKRDNSI